MPIVDDVALGANPGVRVIPLRLRPESDSRRESLRSDDVVEVVVELEMAAVEATEIAVAKNGSVFAQESQGDQRDSARRAFKTSSTLSREYERQ